MQVNICMGFFFKIAQLQVRPIEGRHRGRPYVVRTIQPLMRWSRRAGLRPGQSVPPYRLGVKTSYSQGIYDRGDVLGKGRFELMPFGIDRMSEPEPMRMEHLTARLFRCQV